MMDSRVNNIHKFLINLEIRIWKIILSFNILKFYLRNLINIEINNWNEHNNNNIADETNNLIGL